MSACPILLALTPPRTSPVTLAGQAQMLAGLAHVRRAARAGVALEIAAEDGHVRFLARVSSTAARAALEGVLAGYYPQGAVVPLSDPAADPARPRPGDGAVAAELRLRLRPELPLKIAEHGAVPPASEDPSAGMGRIVGALRRLEPGTRGVCQVILWPGPRRWSDHITRERDRAIARERAPLVSGDAATAVAGPMAALGLAGVMGGLAAYHAYTQHGMAGVTPFAESLSGGGALVLLLWRLAHRRRPLPSALLARKAASPAFTARLRLLVAGGDAAARHMGLDALIAAYSAFAEETGNSFVARRCAPSQVAAITAGGGPPLWPRPWPILCADEVAALCHLPADQVDLPGLARTGPRVLLPSSPAFGDGIPVGAAAVGAHSETVHLPDAVLRTNTIVLGATGTGKSTFAQHLIRHALAREDVQVVVIDPDADLVTDIAGWLDDREKLRAVVLDFGHPERVPGLNLLDAHTGRDDDQVIGAIVEAWRRYYEAWGERLEDLLRNALRTLLTVNRRRRPQRQLTLFDVKPLIQDQEFRELLIAEAADIRVTRYWHKDYLDMPRAERLTATKPVLTRVGKLADNAHSLAILSQRASTVDLRALFASGAPLFINSAAAIITDETAALLDATLINILHALVCARSPEDRRARQVLIVLDEFQHAPALYDKYLPRIRKHRGAYLCIAQGMAQMDSMQAALHQTVFNNAATHVFFRTRDYDDADYLAHVLDGDRLSYRDVQLLGLRQCYIATGDGETPLDPVLVTLPPPPPSSPAAARLIVDSCARRFGRSRNAVVAAYQSWLTDLYYADRIATRRRLAAPAAAEAAPNEAESGPTSAAEAPPEQPAPSAAYETALEDRPVDQEPVREERLSRRARKRRTRPHLTALTPVAEPAPMQLTLPEALSSAMPAPSPSVHLVSGESGETDHV